MAAVILGSLGLLLAGEPPPRPSPGWAGSGAPGRKLWLRLCGEGTFPGDPGSPSQGPPPATGPWEPKPTRVLAPP